MYNKHQNIYNHYRTKKIPSKKKEMRKNQKKTMRKILMKIKMIQMLSQIKIIQKQKLNPKKRKKMS